ncbi:MAG: hypothetical protein Q8J78_00800 [Moraxellaceae bacterium]|nr:hypothetical protein [Moraxellaceae bacterium]
MMKISKVLLAMMMASSMSAWAMEDLSDESLSEATGQDGIVISTDINIPTSAAVRWTDTNGIPVGTYAGFTNSGSVEMVGFGLRTCTGIVGACTLTTGQTGLSVTLDAGGSTGTVAGNGSLAIAISTNGNALWIDLDKIEVFDTAAAGVPAQRKTIIDLNNPIKLTNFAALISLGNEPVGGHMVTLNSNIGTIDFGNIVINDASVGAGNIDIGSFQLGGVNLTNAFMDVATNGLVVNTGTGLGAMTVTMNTVKLGGAAQPALGNITMTGLNLNNQTIRISGKI